MTLRLISVLSGENLDFEVTDANSSRLYWTFEDFQLPENVLDGQYRYELYSDENEPLANGILQIGDYKNNDAIIYSNNNSERIIYEG